MKRFLSLLLAALMLLSAVPFLSAAEPTSDGQAAAEKLHTLGLLAGIGKNADGSVNFDVNGQLTRAQAVTQIVRFLGAEATAKSKTDYVHPFTDLPTWAVPYVGYAYTNGITKGVSNTKFGTDTRMADAAFLTLILRVLGYDDVKASDFTWDKPYTLAKTVGLTDSETPDADFTRGDAFVICYRALTATVKSGDKICDKLVKSGAVDADIMEKVMNNIPTTTMIGNTPITECSVVVSKDASASEERVAKEIIANISAVYGVTLPLVTDDTAAASGEIVVGSTTRAVSAKVDTLTGTDAAIIVSGNSVALGAASSTLLRQLLSYFIGTYVTGAPVLLTEADTKIGTFAQNPVRATPSAGDPCIVYDEETEYYYAIYSAPKNDRVTLYRVKNIADLATAEGKDIYVAGDDKEIKYKLYAPEIKKLNGKWYIYASGATKTREEEAGLTASPSIRLFCLEATTDDPFGEYTFKGFLNDTIWAIDAHPFTYKGENYIAFARILNGNVITVARLENPWTIDTKRVSVIATATYPFETQNGKINEGPFTFESPDGRLFLLYSANNVSSEFYSLGMLELTGNNVLSKASWTKREEAVFTGNTSFPSPGHCSVFKSPDGSELWLAYHYQNKTVKPRTRSLAIKRIVFDAAGDPVFGTPLVAYFTPAGE